MRRAPTLTKRQRRELESVPSVRLERPRTLTRMRTPAALPAGFIQCPNCRDALEVAGLFALQLLEPAKTVNDNDEVIDNPIAGTVAISGHMCPVCQTPIWPEE